MTTLLTVTILTLIAVAYLRQIVKQAVVSPVKQQPGKPLIPPLLSEKRRYEVIWEAWKFFIGLAMGLTMGGYLAWVLCG